MLNVSIMPTIRQGSHRLIRVEPDLGTLSTSKPLTWGVITARKGWVQPCRAFKYEDLLGGDFTGLKKRKS